MILNFVRSIPSGVRSFAREVRKEYAARSAANAAINVARFEAALENMSAAQRAQHEADRKAIGERAAELIEQRRGKLALKNAKPPAKSRKRRR